MNTIKFKAKKVKVIAHRGLSGVERENTNAAFVAAGNRESYFGIETDVHVTRDKKFAIIHDDNTIKVYGKDINIEGNDFEAYSDLRALDKSDDIVRSDLCVPLLSEYIRICKKYGKLAVLELKNPMETDDLYAIMEEIDSFDMLPNTVIISFDWGNCVNVRKKYTNQKVQYLRTTKGADELGIDEIIRMLKENNIDFDVQHNWVTKERIKRLHKEGIEVNVWTVDDKERAEELVKMGVDYITTNKLEAK